MHFYNFALVKLVVALERRIIKPAWRFVSSYFSGSRWKTKEEMFAVAEKASGTYFDFISPGKERKYLLKNKEFNLSIFNDWQLALPFRTFMGLNGHFSSFERASRDNTSSSWSFHVVNGFHSNIEFLNVSSILCWRDSGILPEKLCLLLPSVSWRISVSHLDRFGAGT